MIFSGLQSLHRYFSLDGVSADLVEFEGDASIRPFMGGESLCLRAFWFLPELEHRDLVMVADSDGCDGVPHSLQNIGIIWIPREGNRQRIVWC